MYFEKRARQACAKFIERNKNISLLRLKQLMCLLELSTIYYAGQPLVNGTFIKTRHGLVLKEIDESYMQNAPEGDEELSPADNRRITILAYGHGNTYKQRLLNKTMRFYARFFSGKKEYDYVDVMRSLGGFTEKEIEEYKAEFEYYLEMIKQRKE